jgi:branched-chain amino acid transport system ATP-binding protein
MLRVSDIHTYYDSSYVLMCVSLEVQEGEVVALLGRNGAGKSTTFKSIVAIVPPRRGEITYRDQDITRRKSFQIARTGIGYVPEERRIYPDLNVRENLEIGRQGAVGRDIKWTIDDVYELFPKLNAMENRAGRHLSGGEQQMLAIGRTLMGSPDLLLLDEPVEGLAPIIVQLLLEALQELKSQGMTVLLAEQNTRFAVKISDRVYILAEGAIGFAGTVDEFLADEEAASRYLLV